MVSLGPFPCVTPVPRPNTKLHCPACDTAVTLGTARHMIKLGHGGRIMASQRVQEYEVWALAMIQYFLGYAPCLIEGLDKPHVEESPLKFFVLNGAAGLWQGTIRPFWGDFAFGDEWSPRRLIAEGVYASPHDSI